MKVILLTDVPKLGKEGEVVTVSDGYARNYLIPKDLVVEATEGRLRNLKDQQKRHERRKAKEEKKAQRTKEKVDGQMVAVQAKCGEGGKLFGAVTSKEIADVLNNKFKVDIDKKRVEIKEPIRQLGEYPVRIKLHQKAVAEVTVKVEEA